MERTSLAKLFLLSVLILFLEMMLIRLMGTEVRIFSYLQNIILISCFLGMGIGCITSGKPEIPLRSLLPLSIIALLMYLPITRESFATISDQLTRFGDFFIWYKVSSELTLRAFAQIALAFIQTTVMLLLIFDCFVPLGRTLGRMLDESPNPISAYSANILGSLAGIWLFAGIGFFWSPPYVWALLVSALFLFVYPTSFGKSKLTVTCSLLIPALMFLSYETGKESVLVWSPYQKLEQVDYADSPNAKKLLVNNVGYQLLLDLSPENVSKHPEAFIEKWRGYSHYDFPFLLKPSPDRVLIVGAGAGNDAAGALRNNTKEVVAVDIDPAIIELGKRFHPEKPYDSPAVSVINDDARAYFSRTTKKFDLIIFGLLDAHTSTALTNVRLDHYVYTRESLAQAKRLLKPGGIVVLSFGMNYDFLLSRIGNTLENVFGEPPLVFDTNSSPAFGWGGTTFVAGADPLSIKATSQRTLGYLRSAQRTTPSSPVRLATDDWPYLYLAKDSIPSPYYLIGFAILLVYVFRARKFGGLTSFGSWSSSEWHFLFLGAAFLLFEVQGISKSSLVLGNTWLVNAVVISGILGMVLLANTIAEKYSKLPIKLCYALLVSSCIFLYCFDLSILNSLTLGYRIFASSIVLSLPILFSGLVFISSFANSKKKGIALGTNLFGALIGGLLQSVSFVFGIKSLLLIVVALYLAAYLTRPKI